MSEGVVVFGPIEVCMPLADFVGDGWMFTVFCGADGLSVPVPDIVAVSDELMAKYIRELMVESLARSNVTRCHNSLRNLFADVSAEWPEAGPVLAAIWPDAAA